MGPVVVETQRKVHARDGQTQTYLSIISQLQTFTKCHQRLVHIFYRLHVYVVRPVQLLAKCHIHGGFRPAVATDMLQQILQFDIVHAVGQEKLHRVPEDVMFDPQPPAEAAKLPRCAEHALDGGCSFSIVLQSRDEERYGPQDHASDL